MADFYEGFDHGVGSFSHTWNSQDIKGVDGGITLRHDSGAMQAPDGNWAGTGFGHYEATAQMSADKQGPAVVLWPSNNQWPGHEIDLVEVINGTPYGTVHWNDNGHDAYATVQYDGVDESRTHTYAADWGADGVSFSVDGRGMGRIDIPSADAAHGDTNVVMSVMNRGDGDTSLTVYDAHYSPWG